LLEEHADWIESHLEDWTVTNNGVLLEGVKRHYMRIRPPECGQPYAHEDCGTEEVTLNNRPPGERYRFEAREIIDAGFLELVRYGVRRADDPLILDSLKVVDHLLRVDTPHGPCWRRYNYDGYGTNADGKPFTGWGVGRAWPLLTGERAHYELAAGRDVKPYILALEAFASEGGMLPEQIWDAAPITMRQGTLKCGSPAGSAMPLVWAHSEYLKLLRSARDGAIFDRVDAVERRYCGAVRQVPKVEVFTMSRAIRRMPAGRDLRILATQPFRVIWSADGWHTSAVRESRLVLDPVNSADLPVAALREGVLSFTLFWMDEQRWEGRNFDLTVENEV
jgi:glucoamylase